MSQPKKYEPYSADEGENFMNHFCANCRHEKFMHTQNDADKKCGILKNRTMVYNVNDEQYPSEWTYDENDNPTCTAFSRYNWFDKYGNMQPDPPEVFNNPNQITIPFETDKL